MSRLKPAPVPLHELVPGQLADFFAVLAERTRGATREGKPFFTCRFRDLRRTVTFMVWADGGWFEDCERWQPGQFFKIRGRYAEHERYGPQIDIQNIRLATDDDRAAGFDPDQFVEKPRRDSTALHAELLQMVDEHIANLPLRRLVRTILERHAGPLQRLPASQRNYYPFPGGLIEHLVSVTRSCLILADRYSVVYPALDRDLIVAGAVLHDIGRVMELAEGPAGGAEPTVPGRLVGHLFLGRDLVRDTARELGDLDAERLQLLEHLIISHLNLPEWGSPRLPLLPECLILHHADDLDAKLEMYLRCLERDPSPGPFTERDPVLGRQLYKRVRKDDKPGA
jgi:3'-5' exoribonuclease